MAEFSPVIRLIQQASAALLVSTQRYRKDRQWALKNERHAPSLPEGWVWSASPSPHERRCRARLASDAAGSLSYEIQLFNSPGGGLQLPLPGGQRRLERIKSLRPRHTRFLRTPDGTRLIEIRPRGPVLRILWCLMEIEDPPRHLDVQIALGAMSQRDSGGVRSFARRKPAV